MRKGGIAKAVMLCTIAAFSAVVLVDRRWSTSGLSTASPLLFQKSAFETDHSLSAA
jgi:hypothetical protein